MYTGNFNLSPHHRVSSPDDESCCCPKKNFRLTSKQKIQLVFCCYALIALGLSLWASFEAFSGEMRGCCLPAVCRHASTDDAFLNFFSSSSSSSGGICVPPALSIATETLGCPNDVSRALLADTSPNASSCATISSNNNANVCSQYDGGSRSFLVLSSFLGVFVFFYCVFTAVHFSTEASLRRFFLVVAAPGVLVLVFGLVAVVVVRPTVVVALLSSQQQQVATFEDKKCGVSSTNKKQTLPLLHISAVSNGARVQLSQLILMIGLGAVPVVCAIIQGIQILVCEYLPRRERQQQIRQERRNGEDGVGEEEDVGIQTYLAVVVGDG